MTRTAWMGVYERISLYAFMLWGAVLALALLLRPRYGRGGTAAGAATAYGPTAIAS